MMNPKKKLTMETTEHGKRILVRTARRDLFEIQCCDPADYPEETDMGDETEWYVWSFAMNGPIPPRRHGYRNYTDIDALVDACDWFGLTLDDIELAPQFTARLDALRAAMDKP